MDQHDVPQPGSCGTGEQEAFGGVRYRVVSPVGLPLVSSSPSLCFGTPAL